MSEWAAKRFWKETSVAEAEGGFEVLLDGRRVKTPQKAALIVPTQAMAEAIRDEWQAQEEKIDPASMPTTRSANAAVDKTTPQRAEVAEMLVNWMGPFYEGKDQLQRDEAMRSCGLAGQTIMLAAKAMGYDSCPMIGFDAVKVAELINLPEDHVVSFMIAIGKATKPAWPKPGQLPLEDVIVHDRFA